MFERWRYELVAVVRELRGSPLIVVAAVLTLAAATGMNVAMFGLVDRALLSPPRHVQDPDRLFLLAFHAPGEPEGAAGMTTTSYVAFRTVRDHVPGFSGAAAWQRGPASVVVAGEQIRAETLLVSGNYFDVLGAGARLGRALTVTDEAEATPSAVLGHSFWISAFRGEPDIVGRHLTAGGIEYTVVGVMPSGFSGHSATSVDIWVPVATAMRANPGWDQNPFRNVVSIVARLDSGATRATATAQTTAALQRGVLLRTIVGGEVGSSERKIAFWLTGVSLLVLLIGVANAATLLLVRGARRARDWAIRTALGATRGRLLSQVCVEATVVASVATGASLVLGYWLDGAVRRVLLPRVSVSDGLQPRTLLAAVAAGVVVGVAAAVAGAWTIPSGARPDQLKDSHASGRARLQNALLVVQTAVSVLLLAGAGMFGRSLYGLLQQDFGLQMDDVLVVDFEQGPDVLRAQHQIFADALDRVRALPGVQSVTPFRTLPFGGHDIPPIAIPGRADPPNMGGQLPYLIAAAPELFDILGVKIVQGRRFEAGDDRGEMVAIVNETMAREGWPGESAIGKCIRIGFDPSFDPFTASGPHVPSPSLPCRRVIGIAKDVRQRSVVPTDYEDRLMQYYVPMSQVPDPPGGIEPGPRVAGLLVRTVEDPSNLIVPLRRLVVNGRANIPYVRVRPYVELLERQVQPWRLGATLLAMFSALAIAVAAIGLYAAFAHAVLERRREMAIRVAIGASPARVVGMILREALRLTAVGIVAGTAGAVMAGRSVQSILYGIVPADPLVLGGAAAAMLVVVAIATSLPARTASRADPNSLLRAE
jgi:predicted permease